MVETHVGRSPPPRCCWVAAALGVESSTSTLAIFASVNLLYFLVFALGKSILSLLCYLMLAPLALGIVLKVLHLAPTEEGPWEIVSRSRVEATVDWLYEHFNTTLEVLRDICLWRDAFRTAQVGCVLLGVGYVASFFSLASLIFLVTWIFFVYTFCASLIQETVCPLLAPYIKMGSHALQSLIHSIPTMEGGKKKL